MFDRSKKSAALTTSQVIRKFLVIFFPAVILVISISWFINYFNAIAEKKIINTRGKDAINHTTDLLTSEFESIVSDLLILASSDYVLNFSNTKNKRNLPHIERTFLDFSCQRKMYDQIRLLDEAGMEIVRVNFNEGVPTAVEGANLQNKRHRYYFKDAYKLGKAEIFVSPFDLNFEQKKIEQPLKPMIRFGTPVFDSDGKKRGIILVNYLGNRILEKITHHARHIQGTFHLLNTQGYWLKGSTPDMEWGFMYPDRKHLKFSTSYPEAWEKLQVANSGQFDASSGHFTFMKINPVPIETSVSTLESPIKENWTLVYILAANEISRIVNSLAFTLLLLDGFLIVVLAVFSWLFARAIVRRKMAEEELAVQQKFKGALEMAGAACHELNQPLQAASNYSQILLNTVPKAEDLHSKVEKLDRQLIKLGKITRKLMNVTSYKTKDYADGSKIFDLDGPQSKE